MKKIILIATLLLSMNINANDNKKEIPKEVLEMQNFIKIFLDKPDFSFNYEPLIVDKNGNVVINKIEIDILPKKESVKAFEIDKVVTNLTKEEYSTGEIRVHNIKFYKKNLLNLLKELPKNKMKEEMKKKTIKYINTIYTETENDMIMVKFSNSFTKFKRRKQIKSTKELAFNERIGASFKFSIKGLPREILKEGKRISGGLINDKNYFNGATIDNIDFKMKGLKLGFLGKVAAIHFGLNEEEMNSWLLSKIKEVDSIENETRKEFKKVMKDFLESVLLNQYY
jgi:hypothetical protein